MATVILGNGSVTYGDGTSQSTQSLPYTNVTDRKTLLSQFTNDLGNYGSFLSSGLVNTTPIISLGAYSNIGVGVRGTGNTTTLTIVSDGNCNCNCACNCACDCACNCG